jgi:hypothetical protein
MLTVPPCPACRDDLLVEISAVGKDHPSYQPAITIGLVVNYRDDSPDGQVGGETTRLITERLISFRAIDSAEANFNGSFLIADGEGVSVMNIDHDGGEFRAGQSRRRQKSEREEKGGQFDHDN